LRIIAAKRRQEFYELKIPAAASRLLSNQNSFSTVRKNFSS